MRRADYLLALVADRPEGAKVNIPAIVRAFTPTQRQICDAIEKLVADGKLDAATLRRPIETPVPAPTQEPTEPPAPVAVDQGDGVEAERAAAPSPIDIDRLLECFGDEFETLRVVAQRYGVSSPNKIVRYARMLLARELVEQAPPTNGQPFCLWRRTQPKCANVSPPESGDGEAKSAGGMAVPSASPSAPVDRAKGFTDAELLELPDAVAEQLSKGAQQRRFKLRDGVRDPTLPPPTPMMDLRDRQVLNGRRHAAAVVRGHEKAATDLLDAEVDPSTQSSATANKMREIQRRRDDEARQKDPLEQAKLTLRRKGHILFEASVTGGPKGRYIVSGHRLENGKPKLLTPKEIIDLAKGIAA